MPVEKTERDIGTLIGEISQGEIKLPEIQRGYIWKPTQVAKLIDSLYRGYPTGSLLFWRTTESPLSPRLRPGGDATAASDPAAVPAGRPAAAHRAVPRPGRSTRRPRSSSTWRPRPSRTRARQPRRTPLGEGP